MTQDQENLIRHSLWNSVHVEYNNLIQTIKNLPYDKNNHALLKSLNYIDDGIIWIKEVIFTASLILGNNENKIIEDENKEISTDKINE